MPVSERLESDQRFFDDLVEKSEAIISITNSSRSIGYRCAVCPRHKDRRLSLAQARAHFKTNVHKEQVQLQTIGVGGLTWISSPDNDDLLFETNNSVSSLGSDGSPSSGTPHFDYSAQPFAQNDDDNSSDSDYGFEDTSAAYESLDDSELNRGGDVSASEDDDGGTFNSAVIKKDLQSRGLQCTDYMIEYARVRTAPLC
ncbi:BZ3500_MvSof-1268-A1-R1_Chr2-2g04849 [Microbotryum saponariae]|uniref:BZ3500_MvSof-1268-A1-R1_Chr2-2g04849 protein n=1 Tax=Microbotryum saponariae TaxID=289078 RepID=A0A2X0L731_9BASI|nr:BZ3500_MvSof-1268-A1-R1_Chr2-2g04849 [Microbotryum saponariae]SDA00318.1 BZ3501_MvSof-1269-A2-R1_Chr2-2g04523 [Microbotryum saponariae]